MKPTDAELGDLIQQSRIAQGYRLFDHEELAVARRGWRRGLSTVPAELVVPAFEEALAGYREGSFGYKLVLDAARRIVKFREKNPEEFYPEVERLARVTLTDPPSPMRSNILGPIAFWLKTRRPPRKPWEQEVIHADRRRCYAGDLPPADEAEVPGAESEVRPCSD